MTNLTANNNKQLPTKTAEITACFNYYRAMISGIETISKTLLDHPEEYPVLDRLEDIYILSSKLRQELEEIIEE